MPPFGDRVLMEFSTIGSPVIGSTVMIEGEELVNLNCATSIVIRSEDYWTADRTDHGSASQTGRVESPDSLRHCHRQIDVG